MVKAFPIYSKKQVNKAGDILISLDNSFSYEEYIWAFDVLTNWRSSHVYPINTFQATLRMHLKKIDPKALVAQRIKRTPSIMRKLRKEGHMKLSTMQDIGGLRAVVQSIENVNTLVNSYKYSTRLSHSLIKINDYIENPKKSGYRSVHLIYRYHNLKVKEYDGLRVEIQIRSKVQHAWATAVETMGVFLEHALKSSEGPEEWLNFFSLAGSAFAYYEECPPGGPYAHIPPAELYKILTAEVSRLRVIERLGTLRIVAKQIDGGEIQGHYHLITLDTHEQTVMIRSYGRRNLDKANEDYTFLEKKYNRDENIQIVLVSAGNIANLQRAYPNYFLDTQEFINITNEIKLISQQ